MRRFRATTYLIMRRTYPWRGHLGLPPSFSTICITSWFPGVHHGGIPVYGCVASHVRAPQPAAAKYTSYCWSGRGFPRSERIITEKQRLCIASISICARGHYLYTYTSIPIQHLTSPIVRDIRMPASALVPAIRASKLLSRIMYYHIALYLIIQWKVSRTGSLRGPALRLI